MRTFAALSLLLLPATAWSAGPDILWYSGNSGGISLGNYSPVPVQQAATNLGVNYVETDVWPVDLGPYGLIFLGLSGSTYSGQQEADLAAFLSQGGMLVLAGDADGYSNTHIAVYNALLTNLGYGSRFVSTSLDPGCALTATSIGTHPINAGISGLQYTYTDSLTLGPAAEELQRGVSGQVVDAVEGSVVLSTDSTQFLDLCALPPVNTTFVENIYAQTGQVGVCDGDGDGVDRISCGGLDCNDNNPAVLPGAVEVLCDGLDNDCDPATAEDPDGDGDGVGVCGDCDDGDATVAPGLSEVCDGLDNNCDGAIDNGLPFVDVWPDLDGDGYGDASATPSSVCAPPLDAVTNDADCDDADATSHPGATEVCDGRDNDCMGGVDDGLPTEAYWPDTDGDGFGDANASPVDDCGALADYVTDDLDCDDGDANVHPDAVEIPGNAIDEDCDGLAELGTGTATGATGTGTGSTPVPQPKLGCSCDTTSPSGGGLALWVALLALLRRRR